VLCCCNVNEFFEDLEILNMDIFSGCKMVLYLAIWFHIPVRYFHKTSLLVLNGNKNS
jgi:hypothetical protein